jgi:hypothetical protein
MLDLYLAGPLDVKRYLTAKWAAVASVMLVMTAGPQLFIFAAYAVENAGPSAAGTPLLLLRILVAGIAVALFYTAVSMGISSLTTRRAVAAVATVLVLLVPTIAVGVAIDSSGAPDELALATPGVATEFAWRVFGDVRKGSDGDPPISHVSTGLVVAGLLAWVTLGAGVCLVSYRRQARRR